ncbi:UV radiation resistance-associated protein-like [Tropilaelaps mercedesae]|uniref:UV radiation resistance-associated protein-like n=1 Tax=Tropilaelaps mercedesae TaxID=418985 RepID=A0A1V9Y3Y3_9ACAR|nr:UV radiation resistance-associated protein-like [Tropilaelaps mercedesae]
MSSDKGLQSFCRRKYSPLFSFQKRLRHIRGVSFRNLRLPLECTSLRLELHDLSGVVVAEGKPVAPQTDPSWNKLDITASHASKSVLVVLFADDRPLLEWTVFLSGLVFVSRHPPDSAVSFTPESLLLILAEGVYCDRSCFVTPDNTNTSQQKAQFCRSQKQLRQSKLVLPTSLPLDDPSEGNSNETTVGRVENDCTNNTGTPCPTEIGRCNLKTPTKKLQLSDSVAPQNQRPKVYVKPAALCDVREKILVESRRLRKSYGVNALNRLSTMERAIRHTTATARTLQSSLERSIADRIESSTYKTRCEIETLRLRCLALKYFVMERETLLDNETKQLIREYERVAQMKAELDEYRHRIVKDREGLRQTRERLQESKLELDNVGLFKRQVSLICELDEYIYPIVQIPNGNGYTICSILVQSMDELKDAKKRADDQIISTGMGYVFHLICMLSIFTGVPLIYPLKYDRNNPVVVDVTIDAFHQKEFPLWVKGKDRLYFEYAVPLLARNVAHLRVHFGLPSMRGKMMPGLYNLLNFFRKKRLVGITSASELSGIGSIVSDSNMSSRCATPERGSPPHGSSPRNTPQLKLRVHSSVPNLASTPLVDILEDVDKGAASDNVS